jgi:uncharacterized membrane protein (UPF0127 family)
VALAVVAAAACGCAPKPAPEPVVPKESPATARVEPEGRQFPLESLQVVEVRVGSAKFQAWLADTPEKQREGLMWVSQEQLGDRAMLFVFPNAEERSFWMKNTPAPLDIAFFSEDRRLLNVGRGAPHSLESVLSDGPAQFVLEVRQGTFQRLGLKKGARLEF